MTFEVNLTIDPVSVVLEIILIALLIKWFKFEKKDSKEPVPVFDIKDDTR